MHVNRKDVLKFSLIALPIIGLLVSWLGFGERGFIHLYKMEKERQTFLERISHLEKENQELLNEIDRLRSDQAYIESVARRELGLIKDNEVIYRFRKEGEKTPPSDTLNEKSLSTNEVR